MVNLVTEPSLLIPGLSPYHRTRYIGDYKHGNITGQMHDFALKYMCAQTHTYNTHRHTYTHPSLGIENKNNYTDIILKTKKKIITIIKLMP